MILGLELNLMRGNKRFSNTTFTKRVDHDGGRHRPDRAMSEPGVCKKCGAVYAHRRWSKSQAIKKQMTFRNPTLIVCPACKQANCGEPRGFLYLDGAFLTNHWEEIKTLVLNEVERASEDNPLARILEMKEGDGHRLSVTTTTEHLAQRLGHALQKAFDGKVHYDFSHENKMARVSWQRE